VADVESELRALGRRQVSRSRFALMRAERLAFALRVVAMLAQYWEAVYTGIHNLVLPVG